jgi:hypothetical protein
MEWWVMRRPSRDPLALRTVEGPEPWARGLHGRVTDSATSGLPRMPHALAISTPRATAEFLQDRRVRTALAGPAILLQPSNQLTRP